MSPNGMRSAGPAEKCSLDSDGFRLDIANMAVGAVGPGPAAAQVEHPDLVPGLQPGQPLGVIVGLAQQAGRGDQVTDQRLGVVRGDYAAGQRRIGQILAIGMSQRVGQFGNAGKCEPITGLRRRVLSCALRIRTAALRRCPRRGIV